MSEGCLDRFCYLTGPRSGQVTNGGCRCVGEQPARAALMRLWRENERLQEAAAQAADLIDKHLYSQREKVKDASAILRRALEG